MNIQEYLRTYPMRGFVFGMYRKRNSKVIENRILALYGFFSRNFSFCEMVRLLLPTRFKSKSLMGKMIKFRDDRISEEVKRHISKYLSKDGSVSLFGKPFYPANGNYGELMEFISEVIIHDQYNASDFLKDGDIVIDAGANIGSFSLLVSNIRKNITVYAFEPVTTTFDTLKKNTGGYENIHCVNTGLSDAAGKQRIYFDKNSSAGSTFNINESDSSEYLSQEVEVETVDRFVLRNKIDKIDLIKIDTEGCESEILTGSRETIKRFSPVIVVSAYHKPGDKAVLPQLINDINPSYKSKLLVSREDDLIFYVDK